MARFVPISYKTHQSSGWDLTSDYLFAAGDALAPVCLEEISQLLPRYSLAFYRASEQEPLQMVAVQGLYPGQNLFLTDKGQWLGGYVPAVYRGYPFRMIPVQESDKLVLCVDEDSASYKAEMDSESQAFFKADSDISDLLIRVREFLLAQYKDRVKTEALLELLEEYGVITPWHIRVDGLPESIVPHSGLYHVNEEKLKALPAEQLQVLNLRGALGLAYAQMLSEHRIQDLTRLFNLHADYAKQKRDTAELNLDQVFGEEEDLFRF